PERRDAVSAVVARWPRFLDAWARLGELGRDDVESYAAFRVGYHRGLDRLRAAGRRGAGHVRARHASNRGCLRAPQGPPRTAAPAWPLPMGNTGRMSDDPIREVDVAGLAAARAAGAPVLDVRQPDEYEAGHVPGALLIPLDQLPARLAEVPPAEGGPGLHVICK